MLDYYVRIFKTVEINSTYYRIPHPRVLEQIERKTPPGFEFIVKLNRSITHERSASSRTYSDFRKTLEPLDLACKLSGLLAQFPWGFQRSSDNSDYLCRIKESLSDTPLFVEFRHDSWDQDDTYEFLSENKIGFCVVDEPRLKGLMPPVVRATTNTGYVRLHGRNAQNWWGKGNGDRYDYLYSEAELKRWVEKVGQLAAEVQKVYVFFNNCHAGQAARNAKLMKSMLGEDVGGQEMLF
jgi:uncharacterized protein YecE (DUF72 family)